MYAKIVLLITLVVTAHNPTISIKQSTESTESTESDLQTVEFWELYAEHKRRTRRYSTMDIAKGCTPL